MRGILNSAALTGKPRKLNERERQDSIKRKKPIAEG